MLTQTVGEIASCSLAAARVLESHGIDPCSGGTRKLAEVCRERNIDTGGLLIELEDVVREQQDWTTSRLRDLIHHLIAVDHARLRSELARLDALVASIVSAKADSKIVLKQLPRVFSSLRSELEVHMRHEEEQVFPVIERYEEAVEAGEPLSGSPFAAFGGPLHLMEIEHEGAGAAMRLLRDLCDGYNPAGGSPRYAELVAGLRRLEVKIYIHMHLENNVLFPRAAALRAPKRKSDSPPAH